MHITRVSNSVCKQCLEPVFETVGRLLPKARWKTCLKRIFQFIAVSRVALVSQTLVQLERRSRHGSNLKHEIKGRQIFLFADRDDFFPEI